MLRANPHFSPDPKVSILYFSLQRTCMQVALGTVLLGFLPAKFGFAASSTYCAPLETTVLGCHAGTKTIAVCLSRDSQTLTFQLTKNKASPLRISTEKNSLNPRIRITYFDSLRFNGGAYYQYVLDAHTSAGSYSLIASEDVPSFKPYGYDNRSLFREETVDGHSTEVVCRKSKAAPNWQDLLSDFKP